MIHSKIITTFSFVLSLLASGIFLSCKDDLTIDNPLEIKSENEVWVELPIELEDMTDGYDLSADNTVTRSLESRSAMDVQLVPALQTRAVSDPLMTAKIATLARIQVLQKMKNGAITSNIYTNITPGKRVALKLTATGADECELIIFARGGYTSDLPANNNWTTSEVPQSVIKNITTAEQIGNMPYLLHLKHVKVIKREADATGYGTIQSATNADVRLRLRRLAARLNVTWDYNVTGYAIQEVTLQNYPTNYVAFPSETEATYPSMLAQFSTYIATENDLTNRMISGWIPRNVRGTVNITLPTRRGRKVAPTGSAFLRFVAVNTNDSKKKLIYRVYLGANATSDFNVYDNTNYTYHIVFHNHTEDIIQSDDRVEYQNGVSAAEGNESFVSTANCFMVEPGGSFCFDPFAYQSGGQTITNDLLKDWCSMAGGGISYVKLHWQTKEQGDIGEPVMGFVNSDTDHTNIVDIKPTDADRNLSLNPAQDIGQCRIYCRVNAALSSGTSGGSGLIAAYDTEGNILWSWHVWVTDYRPDATGNATVLEPENKRKLKFDYGNHPDQLPMMDRNLGAMAGYVIVPPDETEKFKTHGFHYQWGRKDPFPSSYSNKYISHLSLSNTADPIEGILNLYKADGVTYLPFSLIKSRASYQMAYQHPQSIYKAETMTNPTWINSRPTDFYKAWQMSKTIHDPCPAGWRVARLVEYLSLFSDANANVGAITYQGSLNLKNSSSYTTDGGILVNYNKTGSESTFIRYTGYYFEYNEFKYIGERILLWVATNTNQSNGTGATHFYSNKSNNEHSLSIGGHEREAIPLRCIQEKQ